MVVTPPEDNESISTTSGEKASSSTVAVVKAELEEETTAIKSGTDIFTTPHTRELSESPPCSPPTTAVGIRPRNEVASAQQLTGSWHTERVTKEITETGSWIAEGVTKEISGLANVRQSREKQIELIQTQRLKLQKVRTRISRELTETENIIEGVDK